MVRLVPSAPVRRRGRPAVVVLHRLPNRLRLGVSALCKGASQPSSRSETEDANPASSLTDVVEQAIGAMPGVTSATANPVIGSLLVEYDGAPEREEAIITAVHDILSSDALPVDEPYLLADVRQVGEALNQATLRASRGRVDLKTALPLILGLYGLSRLLTERPFRPPSGLTMVWWAYTSIRQLTRESKR
jgi:hypothetical protein